MATIQSRSGIGIFLLLFSLSLSSAVFAQQQSVTKTPAASLKQPAIKSKAVADFCRRHKQAKTIAFSAYLASYAGKDFGFISMNNFTVVAKRPNQFAVRGGPDFKYVREVNGRKSVGFMGTGSNVCISDGKTMLEVHPGLRLYTTSPAPAKIFLAPNTIVEYLKGEIVLNTDLLTGLAGFEPAPDEDLFARPTIVFARTLTTDSNLIHQEKIIFDAKTGELLQFAEFTRVRATGEESETFEIIFDNWKFDAPMPASLFDTTPPPTAMTKNELDLAMKAMKAARAAKH